MSNRNYNASVITQHVRDKTIASNIVTNMNNGTTISPPQNSISNTSIINEIHSGQMSMIFRGNTDCTIDFGCPCSQSTVIIPDNTPTPPIPPIVNLPWATYLFDNVVTSTGKVSVKTDSIGNIHSWNIYIYYTRYSEECEWYYTN